MTMHLEDSAVNIVDEERGLFLIAIYFYKLNAVSTRKICKKILDRYSVILQAVFIS